MFNNISIFEIKLLDYSQEVIADAKINANDKTITITYRDTVKKYSDINIEFKISKIVDTSIMTNLNSGSKEAILNFELSGEGVLEKVRSAGKIKFGNQEKESRYLSYSIDLSRDKKGIKGAKVFDFHNGDGKLVKDKIKIIKGTCYKDSSDNW